MFLDTKGKKLHNTIGDISENNDTPMDETADKSRTRCAAIYSHFKNKKGVMLEENSINEDRSSKRMRMKKGKNKTFTVSVSPGKKLLSTDGEKNLLALLMENAIPLRSDCGGNGACQKCLVNITDKTGIERTALACNLYIQEDLHITIPESSLTSSYIMKKADIYFPDSFLHHFQVDGLCPAEIGVAVDLGTTTIAVYLFDQKNGTVISSLTLKNPQSLYGADVISRISYIGNNEKRLQHLQGLVIKNIKWSVDSLLQQYSKEQITPNEFVIVGNPAMIHIFLGISPVSIGVSPYQPQFISAQNTSAELFGKPYQSGTIFTLPLISGFVGCDLLAAAIATELSLQPDGTLLIDLGTNGELILKKGDGYWATSCATGPAFEGANISCGSQAIPGAIHKVKISPDLHPLIFIIKNEKTEEPKPIGVCGSGIISCIAECLHREIIQSDGSFCQTLPEETVIKDENGSRYLLYESLVEEIFISQKDIRNVQLGKAALISGIEFLLKAADLEMPSKIIVAGAFGSHLNKMDLLTLGMLPSMPPDRIVMAGNAAGAGAVMCLCNNGYRDQAADIAKNTNVINLAEDKTFQTLFVKKLSF